MADSRLEVLTGELLAEQRAALTVLREQLEELGRIAGQVDEFADACARDLAEQRAGVSVVQLARIGALLERCRIHLGVAVHVVASGEVRRG